MKAKTDLIKNIHKNKKVKKTRAGRYSKVREVKIKYYSSNKITSMIKVTML